MPQVHITFPEADRNLKGDIQLPASKSISNRLLLIKALCAGDFLISNLSEAQDTKVLLEALKSIGDTSEIQKIDVQDAGTAFRFLTAYLSIQQSNAFILTGTERMQQRPIAPLVDALRQSGADIYYIWKEQYPPLLIRGKKLQGGSLEIQANVSSQFISALCLMAPLLDNGLELTLAEEVVSGSYIDMTLKLMNDFGISTEYHNNQIKIQHQVYQVKDIFVESDWSSAAFFYALAMLSDTACFQFQFIKEKSVQGDSHIKQLATDFGIASKFENDTLTLAKDIQRDASLVKVYDLSSYPDMAVPLIVACAIRFPLVQFTGLKHLQYKESDRIAALATELAKADIILSYDNDVLRFNNSNYKPTDRTIRFNTYDDHRIAMSLSFLALEGFTVILNDGACVAKSFPGYFEELEKIGFIVKYE